MNSALKTAGVWAEMIKLGHSVFALPYALLAVFLAARPTPPTLLQFALILVCMVGARSAAMTFNRLVDAKYDAANPRTAMRAIPAGLISPRAGWLFFAAACAVFLAGCAGFLAYGNPWPIALGPLVIAVLCGYSFTKRFTRWSHLYLGASIALSPVAAWIAIRPETLGLPALLLMAATALWIAGFDVIYACQDVEFDRAARLHSLPARLGVGPALWIARGFHVLTVAALVAVGVLAQLGALYAVGVACVALLLLVENALVSPRDLSRVNLAFFTVNGVVGVLLGALGILDVVLAYGTTA